MLNLECYDEHPNSAAGRGVKISLHQQGTFPPRQGATIPAGVKVTVGFDTKTVSYVKLSHFINATLYNIPGKKRL